MRGAIAALAGCALCAAACGCEPEYGDSYWRGYRAGREDEVRQAEVVRAYASCDSTGFMQWSLGRCSDCDTTHTMGSVFVDTLYLREGR